MPIGRAGKLRRRMLDAVVTKLENREVKDKERIRRRNRMVASLRAGSLPYAPPVMSWLSRELDKKPARITQADVQSLLK